ncbi:MAG: hypothetical protein ACLFS2_10010 [Halochromatium sp.]|uniref:hypothetical protein n=1 Tax=Halochromatium sp. TaxID=2049430 RepID=UPI00397867DD
MNPQRRDSGGDFPLTDALAGMPYSVSTEEELAHHLLGDGTMAYTFEDMQREAHEWLKDSIRKLDPDEVLQCYNPDDVLQRYTPEERLKGLDPDAVRRVLVFFGGTDPDNLSERALTALTDPALAALQVDVLVGANNPHRIATNSPPGPRRAATPNCTRRARTWPT